MTMADVTLTITQPANGAGLIGPVTLVGSAVGNTAGLFFKWFSSLNSAATEAKPEINPLDHSLAALSHAIPVLGEFGSHALVLAATDREGIDLASVKAITRSALAGGAPPAAPTPCVVHQLAGAQFLNPASDGLNLSKASATIDFLAPGAWLKPGPANTWVANTDYQALNGVLLSLRLEPDGPADAAHSADIALNLPALPFFRQNDKTWLRKTGPLPVNLGTGAYRLLLKASAGGQTVTVTRHINLSA
ncbi:hypothetical protein [Ideonella azotifigens]|nr:hypothetical protein [Ideonella azotifigens]